MSLILKTNVFNFLEKYPLVFIAHIFPSKISFNQQRFAIKFLHETYYYPPFEITLLKKPIKNAIQSPEKQ